MGIVGHRNPDLVQAGVPEKGNLAVRGRFALVAQGIKAVSADALSLIDLDLIPAHELANRCVPHVVVVEAPQEIVEHSETQSTVGMGHALDFEFLETADMMATPPGRTGNRSERTLEDPKPPAEPALTRLAETVQPFAGDPRLACRVEAVEFQDVGNGPRRTRDPTASFQPSRR